MKNGIKKLAAVLVCVGILGNTPAYSGMPVIDYAAIADRFMDALDRATMLANWKTQLEHWVRGKLENIEGVKKFLDSRQTKQIEQMFDKREQRCRTIGNLASRRLCTSTVQVERLKYKTLQDMEEDIGIKFREINATINAQRRAGKSGEAQTEEQEVQKKLAVLKITLDQYQARITSLDQLLEQYKWARINLTKDQLSGSGNKLAQAAAFVALKNNARDYRKKASDKRDEGIKNVTEKRLLHY